MLPRPLEGLLGYVLSQLAVPANPDSDAVHGALMATHEHRACSIVTEGDLVIEAADVRLPHYFELFGNLVYLGSQKKFEERLKKMVGNAVADVMTTEVFTVGPDDPAPRAANIMVDKKVNRVPVVDGDRLVGIVARHDIIRMLGL